MAPLPMARPADAGFDANRLQKAYDLLKHWTETDRVPAAGLAIGRKGRADRTTARRSAEARERLTAPPQRRSVPDRFDHEAGDSRRCDDARRTGRTGP